MAREMKDSGVEWIGKIPKEWKSCKLLYCLRQPICDGPHETPNFVEQGIPFISVDSLNDTKNINLDIVKKFISEEDYNNYMTKAELEKGDILFSKSATIGKTAIVGNEKFMIWSPLAVLKSLPEKCNRNYLYYLLNCRELITAIKLSGTYNTQANVGMRQIEKAKIPLPPLIVQEKITNYLDKKVADIDLIIEKTKATIEDYKKYKQSIITEAVTKGLNPDVEMKDSRIEWIGQIPKHWDLKKFKNILIERNEKNIPIKTSERLSLSIDKGVTLYSEKTTNLDRFKEDVSQYKIAHINDLVLNSMNMIVGAVGVSKYFGCVSPVYYTYYDKTKNSPTPKFCNYLFSSKTIKKVLFSLGRGIMAIDRGDDKINTCRLKVSRDDLRSLIFPIPSLKEQQQIVEYLDKKVAEIDNLIAKKESLISEMEEYKKSLIYECVTGKKEII